MSHGEKTAFKSNDLQPNNTTETIGICSIQYMIEVRGIKRFESPGPDLFSHFDFGV